MNRWDDWVEDRSDNLLVEQAINGRLRRAKRQLAEHLRRHGFDEVDL